MLVDGINYLKQKGKAMPKNKKNKYMFAEFHSQKEYQDAYKSVMDNTITNSQFELVIFIERLRTTMLCSLEPISKTERK